MPFVNTAALFLKTQGEFIHSINTWTKTRGGTPVTKEQLQEALRIIGSRGGRRAAEKLTAAQRSARAKHAVTVREAKRAERKEVQ